MTFGTSTYKKKKKKKKKMGHAKLLISVPAVIDFIIFSLLCQPFRIYTVIRRLF